MTKNCMFALALLAILALSSFSKKKHCDCPSKKIAGTTYSLDTCGLDITLHHGKGNQQFAVTLKQDVRGYYGFNVHGYGEGFPVYSFIANEASGGAYGDQVIHFTVSDKYLVPNGTRDSVYQGYILICVRVDTNGAYQDQGCLQLPVHVRVKP